MTPTKKERNAPDGHPDRPDQPGDDPFHRPRPIDRVYAQTLGFEKRTDVPFGQSYRWVEVYPPSGTTGIALAPPREGDPVGIHTGISLTTDDIDATHAQLLSSGVDVDAEVARMGEPVPPMFWFRDPDANTLLIVEQR